MVVRLVSLNTWGGRLWIPLKRFLTEVDADVWCLQEVFSAPGVEQETLRDSDGLEVRLNLFAEAQEVLNDYQCSFWPEARGYLNDRTSTESPVLYGIATCVRNTIPIIGSRTEFVFGDFRQSATGEPPLPRTLHFTRLWNYEKGCALWIGHFHGLWSPDGKVDNAQRDIQAAKLTAAIESLAPGSSRIILSGDFNVLPDSTLFQLLKRVELTDLVTKYNYDDTRTSYYSKSPRHADYMLVTPGVTVVDFDVPAAPEVSDHRPLILDFE